VPGLRRQRSTPGYSIPPSSVRQIMDRRIEPEWLDALPADDPRAIRSRRDLRRLNALMGNVGAMASTLLITFSHGPPKRIVDLGAGDGTMMLGLARRLARRWRHVEAVLVDRQAIVRQETQRQFEALSWSAKPVTADILDWFAQPARDPVGLITANLFLHHFSGPALLRLLRLAAERTGCFVACEPRRYPAAVRASRWLWLIGCGRVTCHDAVASVRAGFNGTELSALWPPAGGWQLQEKPAGLFTHCFVARHLGGQPTSPQKDGADI